MFSAILKVVQTSSVEQEVASVLSDRAVREFNKRLENCGIQSRRSAGLTALVNSDNKMLNLSQEESSIKFSKTKVQLKSNRNIQANRQNDLRIAVSSI